MVWEKSDVEKWMAAQRVKRSYIREVASKVHALSGRFEVLNYGALSIDPDLYPLFLLHSKGFSSDRKTVLITGGVHGYETSGVHGALAFMERLSDAISSDFNFICAPCLSPWAYETVNRWNPQAIDPNRSFVPASPAEECRLFLKAMEELGVRPFAHFDLHETTDTDNTIFRPAKAARDGVEEELSEIPDGFYVVGDSENPCAEFQAAIIASVRSVTHIALPDVNGKLIGVPLEQEGVVNYPLKNLGLCAGFSSAKYTTTTEVYPDSPRVTPSNCVDAQVAAIMGGLGYLRQVSAGLPA